MPLGAIYAAATGGQPPANLDDSFDVPPLKPFLKSCWAFAAESRPNMKTCQSVVFRLGPHYREVSEYFRGYIRDLDFEKSPCDRIEGLEVRYNPGIDRTLEIKAMNVLKVPGRSVGLSFIRGSPWIDVGRLVQI